MRKHKAPPFAKHGKGKGMPDDMPGKAMPFERHGKKRKKGARKYSRR